MTKKDLLKMIEKVGENDEITFYVLDYEYADENGKNWYDVGVAKLHSVEHSPFSNTTYLELHVHAKDGD